MGMSHCVLRESVRSRMQYIKKQNGQTADKYRGDKQAGIFEGKAVIRNLCKDQV